MMSVFFPDCPDVYTKPGEGARYKELKRAAENTACSLNNRILFVKNQDFKQKSYAFLTNTVLFFFFVS